MRLLSALRIATLLGALAILAGCSDEPQFVALCSSDAQCHEEHGGNTNWACDRQIGDCTCTADAACVGQNEHCELRPGGDGRCHPNVRCETNLDCERGDFCDTDDGFCRGTGCTTDMQCGAGFVCDQFTQTCTEGCRSHGDCGGAVGSDPLTCMCTDGNGNPVPCTCDSLDENERLNCPVGQCTAGTCADKTFCRYGDLCVEPDDETQLNSCQTDERGPYCSNCVGEAGTTGSCGSDGPNFCLVDRNDPSGMGRICGVDCSAGQECPNGFSCHDILVLTDGLCTSDAQCSPDPAAPSCTEDSDCPGGARCAGGKCAGSCMASEGSATGFCSCVVDADCPTQSCGTDGRCSITRDRCVPGQNDTCTNQIFCVNEGNVGYCKIGRNCAPDDGITCRDVRCEQDPTGCE